MNGDWLEASIRVPRTQAELAEQLLLSQGALAVTLTDLSDTPLLEPGVDETPLWDEVQVTGLFTADFDIAAAQAALALLPGASGQGGVRLRGVPDQAWERAWMTGFAPMRFGQRLWIVPSGMRCPAAGAVELHLDPGLAFGTGTHPTTHLCLEWLEAQELAGLTVLDYGCGSGVLGIAAALLGARQVWCVDNDPQALLATVGNARRNGVAERVQALDVQTAESMLNIGAGVTVANAGTHMTADIVVANILANTLIQLAPVLEAALTAGGRLALSGILQGQEAGVAAAFTRFPDFALTSREEWILLSSNGP